MTLAASTTFSTATTSASFASTSPWLLLAFLSLGSWFPWLPRWSALTILALAAAGLPLPRVLVPLAPSVVGAHHPRPHGAPCMEDVLLHHHARGHRVHVLRRGRAHHVHDPHHHHGRPGQRR